MSSNGLNKTAIKGTCRMCLRTRTTGTQVKAVGEVRHGFAVGHIWECINTNDCDAVIKNKLQTYPPDSLKWHKITQAVKEGRAIDYYYIN